MSDAPIEERTHFLSAIKWTPEERHEIELVLEWLTDFPDEAAAYIIWMENNGA